MRRDPACSVLSFAHRLTRGVGCFESATIWVLLSRRRREFWLATRAKFLPTTRRPALLFYNSADLEHGAPAMLCVITWAATLCPETCSEPGPNGRADFIVRGIEQGCHHGVRFCQENHTVGQQFIIRTSIARREVESGLSEQ
jgi:hypothetical protein